MKPAIKKFGDFTVYFTEDVNHFAVQYKKKDIYVHINDYEVGYRVNNKQGKVIFDISKVPLIP